MEAAARARPKAAVATGRVVWMFRARSVRSRVETATAWTMPSVVIALTSLSIWYLPFSLGLLPAPPAGGIFLPNGRHAVRWLPGLPVPILGTCPDPGFRGGYPPRTPGFTFGRPKVNRKTAKTKVLDSFS